MWQDTSSYSTQASVTFSYSGNSGDYIVLKDENEKEIITLKTVKSYSRIILSTVGLEIGKTYSLYVNGEKVGSKELTSVVNSEGNSGGMGTGFDRKMNGNMEQMDGINRKTDKFNNENI